MIDYASLQIPTRLFDFYASKTAAAFHDARKSRPISLPEGRGDASFLGISCFVSSCTFTGLSLHANKSRLILRQGDEVHRVALYDLQDTDIVLPARAMSRLADDLRLRMCIHATIRDMPEPPKGWRAVCLPNAVIIFANHAIFPAEPTAKQTPQAMVKEGMRIMLRETEEATRHSEMAAFSDGNLSKILLLDHERHAR